MLNRNKPFIPLVSIRADATEQVPLFASDKEERMKKYTFYLKRLDYNRYHLRAKHVPDIYTVAALRIRCPLCGTFMNNLELYPPLFGCPECEHV